MVTVPVFNFVMLQRLASRYSEDLLKVNSKVTPNEAF